MTSVLAEGFDEARLARQQLFYLDRAAAHDAVDDDRGTWHSACAASLTRDAAAVALLNGDNDQAAKLFHKSGQRFAELGMFSGFALLEFGHTGSSRNWRTQHQDVDARVRKAVETDEEQARPETFHEPFLHTSAASPRQLLYLYQVLRPEHVTGGDQHLRSRVREKLLRLPEFPVGPTDTPLAGYLRLLDEVNQIDSGDASLSLEARDTLLSMILRRREQLNAAQADKWHWKMVLNPTALLDFDLVMLATILIDRTGSVAAFGSLVEDRGSLVALPLRAAKLLRYGS